jgi:type III restriction enzyme
MGIKDRLVINDEGHHCYREKPGPEGEQELKGDERKEAEKNNEAARLWISGLEVVNRKLGVTRVLDLSATPFFLRGSGYAEGTLFPWTVSDFSLMDAIESGIVKLPRVPVADNIPGGEMPGFRDLWEYIRAKMPKKGRGKSDTVDPLSIPVELQTALETRLRLHLRLPTANDCISSGSSNASPTSGSTPAWSARAEPIRRSSCVRI